MPGHEAVSVLFYQRKSHEINEAGMLSLQAGSKEYFDRILYTEPAVNEIIINLIGFLTVLQHVSCTTV
jgi:hypothetical protein